MPQDQYEQVTVPMIPAPIRPGLSPAMADLIRASMVGANLAPWIADGWAVVSVNAASATLTRPKPRPSPDA
jgi:hypothetical protein